LNNIQNRLDPGHTIVGNNYKIDQRQPPEQLFIVDSGPCLPTILFYVDPPFRDVDPLGFYIGFLNQWLIFRDVDPGTAGFATLSFWHVDPPVGNS